MYTVFGVQVVERSVCQRDGRWFLKLLQAETDRMEGWCRQMELDQQENDLPEDSRSLFVSVSDHFVFSNCVIRQESESWTQLSVSVIHKRLTGKLFSSLFFFLLVLGKMRSAVGSAQLLMSQKFQQFRELCEENLVSTCTR